MKYQDVKQKVGELLATLTPGREETKTKLMQDRYILYGIHDRIFNLQLSLPAEGDRLPASP